MLQRLGLDIYTAQNIFLTLTNCFTDPDLTISVDLEREEQEKNGRRKLFFFLFDILLLVETMESIVHCLALIKPFTQLMQCSRSVVEKQ